MLTDSRSAPAASVVLCCWWACSASRAQPALPSADDFPAPKDLPARPVAADPLVMMDGTPVKTADDWYKRRRPEVRRLIQHYLFGYAGPEKLKDGTPPTRVLAEDDKALDGKATGKLIRVHLAPDPTVAVHVHLYVPNRAGGAFPMVLCIGWPMFRASPLLDAKAATQPQNQGILEQVKYVIGRGYAFAQFRHNEAADNRFDRGIYPHYRPTRGQLVEERYGGGRTDHDWGEKAAWSWCARRVLDVLGQQKGVDGRRVAVEGLSRNGMAAVLTGALDDRVALVICHQGSNYFREGINKDLTYWYARVLQDFQERKDRLPADTHFALAAIAPRPALLSTSRTAAFSWPKWDAAVIRGAAPVYRLLGKPITPVTIPKSGTGIVGTGPVRMYHRDGKHTITPGDWRWWLDFADEFFRPATR